MYGNILYNMTGLTLDSIYLYRSDTGFRGDSKALLDFNTNDQ